MSQANATREAPAQGRVEIWRGGGRFSLNCFRPFRLSVSDYLTMSPFPDPAHQTGRADFLHPAFGQGTQRSRTRWNPAPPSLKPLNVVCTCRGFKAFLGPRGANRFPLVTSNAALELRSLRSTIITRFFTTMDLSDSQFSPAPILADRRLLGLAPKHCAGSPVGDATRQKNPGSPAQVGRSSA